MDQSGGGQGIPHPIRKAGSSFDGQSYQVAACAAWLGGMLI